MVKGRRTIRLLGWDRSVMYCHKDRETHLCQPMRTAATGTIVQSFVARFAGEMYSPFGIRSGGILPPHIPMAITISKTWPRITTRSKLSVPILLKVSSKMYSFCLQIIMKPISSYRRPLPMIIRPVCRSRQLSFRTTPIRLTLRPISVST